MSLRLDPTRLPTVCAAMIVRNEQHFLPGCLESLRGRIDELVIVDTGSTDETCSIAYEAGATLLRRAWDNDFSAARNAALDAAVADWILYIDADERLNLPSEGKVSDYLCPDDIAAFVRFRPKTGYTRYLEWRLFRNDPQIRFEGKIHETMIPSIRTILSQERGSVAETAIEIDHFGYDGDQSHKYERNLPLLQDAVRAHPNRIYYWHHLAETLRATGATDQACEAARQGIARADRDTDEESRAAASLLIQFLARSEIAKGDDPIQLIDRGLSLMPHDYALLFLRGRARLDAGYPAEALEIAVRLRAMDPESFVLGRIAFDMRIFKEFACELAALACLRLGRRDEAGRHFADAARLNPQHRAYRVKAMAFGAMRAEGFARRQA